MSLNVSRARTFSAFHDVPAAHHAARVRSSFNQRHLGRIDFFDAFQAGQSKNLFLQGWASGAEKGPNYLAQVSRDSLPKHTRE